MRTRVNQPMTDSTSGAEIKLRYWAAQRSYNDFYAWLDEDTMGVVTGALVEQMRDIEKQFIGGGPSSGEGNNYIECMRQQILVIEAATRHLSRLYGDLLSEREGDLAFRDQFNSLAV
jgi:hypothetical protein